MGTDPRHADPLRRGLLDLKDRGCALLVENDARGAGAACHRLGGHADRGRRRCYVPITTTVASVLDRHAPSPRRSEYLGIVDATAAESARSMATPIQPGQIDANAEWYTPHDDLGDLPAMADLVEAHIDRFADRAGTLAPGEVRLCIESLDPFLDDTSATADLRAFLDSMTALVREHRAIGHFHVAGGTDPAVRDSYASLFDATVRVRTVDGATQQRWSLHDTDVETGWLPLERQ